MKTIRPIYDAEANLLTIRDPMILPVGDTYYLTGTQPPYWQGVNAGVHLWSTKDLEHYTDHGLILKREDMPEDLWCRDRFWAPELFDGKDGWFYLTFNCRNEREDCAHPHNVGLARSRQITGPYELVTLERPLTEYDTANDATMFRDDDGTIWLGCNNTARWLTLQRFDPVALSLSAGQRVAEKGTEGEWDFIGVEGQCFVKRHGTYFQWYSSWTNGYDAGILTSASMNGPWIKHPLNPILSNNEIWHRAGHNHCFRGFDGQDYLIFHANSRNPEDPQTESMFIVPVDYQPDGTVIVYADSKKQGSKETEVSDV